MDPKAVYTIFFFLLASICFGQKRQSFTIEGKLNFKNPEPDWIYFGYRHDGIGDDSTQVINGKFLCKGKMEEPHLYWMRLIYKNTDPTKVITQRRAQMPNNPKRDVIMLFIEPGKIKITSVDSFSNVVITGLPIHNDYIKLERQNKPYTEKVDSLIVLRRKFFNAKDTANTKRIEKIINETNEERKELVYANYIRSNPSSSMAMDVLTRYCHTSLDYGWMERPEMVDKVEELYKSLSSSIKQYPSAIKLRSMIEGNKRSGIGRMAMDFTQADTSGKLISFSLFRGKWILIDFWASWCMPCKVESPKLVRLFDKYKDKNFYIIGISLDNLKQKEAWMKAIHDDKLYWTQLCDFKGGDNEVAIMYGIEGIWQNVLIDPNGKIVAKNLTGEELDQKLQELLIEKKPSF